MRLPAAQRLACRRRLKNQPKRASSRRDGDFDASAYAVEVEPALVVAPLARVVQEPVVRDDERTVRVRVLEHEAVVRAAGRREQELRALQVRRLDVVVDPAARREDLERHARAYLRTKTLVGAGIATSVAAQPKLRLVEMEISTPAARRTRRRGGGPLAPPRASRRGPARRTGRLPALHSCRRSRRGRPARPPRAPARSSRRARAPKRTAAPRAAPGRGTSTPRRRRPTRRRP